MTTAAELEPLLGDSETKQPELTLLRNSVEMVQDETEELSPFVAFLESTRNVFDGVIDGDVTGKLAIKEYKNVLDLMSIGQGGHDNPIDLAELCVACTPEEKLTDSLLTHFLERIPGVSVRELDPEQNGGMLSKIYDFKDDTCVNNAQRARVFRAEHDFYGERRVYYSLTRGSV